MSAHWPVKWEEPTEVILQKQQETVGILAACGGEDGKSRNLEVLENFFAGRSVTKVPARNACGPTNPQHPE